MIPIMRDIADIIAEYTKKNKCPKGPGPGIKQAIQAVLECEGTSGILKRKEEKP